MQLLCYLYCFCKGANDNVLILCDSLATLKAGEISDPLAHLCAFNHTGNSANSEYFTVHAISVYMEKVCRANTFASHI